jgi:hypothetical protein
MICELDRMEDTNPESHLGTSSLFCLCDSAQEDFDKTATSNDNDLQASDKNISDRIKSIHPVINVLMNVMTTFALSFAIYMFVTNVFLLIHNMNTQSYNLRSSLHLLNDRSNVDCSNIHDLSLYECHQLNQYRRNYQKLKQEQNQPDHEPLRVNTTLFMF